ncbi:hypothetical protein PV327_000398 [Microctonus hyperodae]|uniref:NADH:ubiquinone oxidoreductase intermediate-associated protein 30 domain-containing protein n=1 Tax=Microctonus hyperodae TaxID=165561 RepID=A0AA39G7V5_MICHY|nr:hypothetical protein PV327_000398 [Microctonus hyperodae]
MTTRFIRLLHLYKKTNSRSFYTTPKISDMFEYDRKSGYPCKSDYIEEPKTVIERIREGFSQFKHELWLLKEELKDNFHMDPTMVLRPGEVDVKWKFDGNPDVLDDWIISTDKDIHDGKSYATLELTPSGKALFSGVLDTVPLRDGKKRQTGYCNIRSVEPLKSFYRSTVHDWDPYTHLILRIRGDGRNYMLNLHLKAHFDVMWTDLHHFVLYTRGGPYWQYVKIPFSKFYFSNRGRIQDAQTAPRRNSVVAISISAADGIAGPFSLEIDFIGVECDETFHEESAYELYNPPHPYYV